MVKNEYSEVLEEIEFVENIFSKLLLILPEFAITDETILPYGLKAHTRSVSWLVEQVITQQAKFRGKELGLDDVDFSMPDTCLHDCVIRFGNKQYYINIKIHNVSGKENKNDIAAVEKLFMQYNSNIEYKLMYACFGISFDNIRIKFDRGYLKVFSPQFMPVYVNPRNDKIQATYHHEPILRSRKDFLNLLIKSSKSIILGN